MRPILFDFNGTLFNDTNLHVLAWQKYFEDNFNIHMSYEDVWTKCMGPANSVIIRTYVDPNLSDEEVMMHSREKERSYRKVCNSKEEYRRLIDGVPEMFDMLRDRGIPYAMVTTSIIENVEFYLNSLGMSRWFTLDNIVYDDGNTPVKPDPAFYRKAASIVNADAKDCIVVEDSATGIRAALNSGVERIIAIEGTLSNDQLDQFPNIVAKIRDYRGFEQLMDSLQD